MNQKKNTTYIVIVGKNPFTQMQITELSDVIGCDCRFFSWLDGDNGRAFEVSCEGTVESDDCAFAQDGFVKVRQYAWSIQADAFLVDEARRRPKLFLADMDSTIVRQESMDEMAGELSQDIKKQIEDITDRSMRGELDFHESIRCRVAMLQDLPESAIYKTIDHLHFTSGAQVLVKTLRANGTICALVTGGFVQFAQWAGDQCGFHHVYANELGIENGMLTGQVLGDIIDKYQKRQILTDLADQYDVDMGDTMAIGDGANDILMIEQAGCGVGFYPKPALASASDHFICHTDLLSVLYLHGYNKINFHNL